MDELRELQILEGHEDRVWAVAWSPKGDKLASCGSDKTVRIWAWHASTKRWFCEAILEDNHTRTIRNCCWSPSGEYLATASFDATVGIWELRNGEWEQVGVLEGHENEVKSVAWNPKSNLIATCGRDKTVWFWEAVGPYDYECVDVKHGHSQDVKIVSWHPGGDALVSASYDDSIKIWVEDEDADEWQCIQTLEGPGVGHESTVWGVAFDEDGKYMASCSDDLTIKIWRCKLQNGEASWKLATNLTGYHERTIFSIDWSKDGSIATGSGDNGIRIFTVEDSDKLSVNLSIKKMNAHSLDVNCVQWSPSDASLLASAGDDGVIKLWRFDRAP